MADRIRVLMASSGSLLKPGGALSGRLVEYRKRFTEFKSATGKVAELAANPQIFPSDSAAQGALAGLRAGLQRWNASRRWLRVWCKWLGMRAQAHAMGLGRVLAMVELGVVPGKEFAHYTDYCYAVWWVKGVIDREPALREFSSAEHDHKIQQFRVADEQFQKLTQKYVFAKLAAGVPETEGVRKVSEMGVLNNELQKRQRHLPIRKLFQSMPNLLPKLKPCLLMSPLSVAQYLDAAHPKFDVVIFDEASQIHVWDAVGAIARGRQVIVVGDPKQLPPSNFFERGESDESSDDASEDAPPQDLDSILEECMGVGMSQLSLDFHYRSKSESLIDFSNKRYYGSRLVTFPAPETRDEAVKLVYVNGVYDRGATRTNRAEADAIVARVVAHFMQDDAKARDLTLGVVTFNQPQMRLIDQLLQQELLQRPELEERIAAHGDEKLFVKNLENVQGDERSIILFSTTYGRDAAGRMPMNFGPVNQEGGQRRLNVAVTRARNAIEIYASVRPDEIDLSKTRSKGVADLKAYLDYALRGARSLAEESLPTGREPDSPFEREVIQVLRDNGWEVHPQVGCSGFRIDIGVVDRGQPGRYLLGVECDGATYHSLATARDRDRLRQSILERLGWRLARVWSTDWWNNREGTAEALRVKVAELQQAADERREKSGPEKVFAAP